MRRLVYGENASPRMDAFLLQAEPRLSMGLLHKYLRQNKIKLNGKKQPLSTRLHNGDEIRLYLPDDAKPPSPALTVLYEDENLLAVDKPAGTPVMDEADAQNPRTLLAQCRCYLAGNGEEAKALALCHRLDTGTSGVVLLAKNPAMLDFVTGQMRLHSLQKQYVCVTYGRPEPQEGVLRGYLYKDAQQARVFIQKKKKAGAKQVETRYKTLAVSGRLALLSVQLVTGRTHQIRAHFASIGTPILGDSKYGNLAANRELRCKYQCLCALCVTFPADVPEGFAPYSGLRIACQKPWYYGQVLNGTLR